MHMPLIATFTTTVMMARLGRKAPKTLTPLANGYYHQSTTSNTALEAAKHGRIIIDTDVGFDDLFALTLLLGTPSIADRIELITTVRGMNTDPKSGAMIVRRLLTLFGKSYDDIPVVAGAEEASDGGGCTLGEIEWGCRYEASYGDKIDMLGLPKINVVGGVDGVATANAMPSKAEAVRYLVNALTRDDIDESTSTTLLCLGPLTNISAAIPSLLTATKNGSLHSKPNVIVMGGAVLVKGNCGPNDDAEFNFHSDPRAAHTVFATASTGIPSSLRAFRSINVVDLSTASNKHCHRVAELIRRQRTRVNRNGKDEASIAFTLMAALKSIDASSSGYDSIAASLIINPSILDRTTVLHVAVDATTGIISPVDSNYPEASTITLARELNVDAFIGTVEGVLCRQ